MDGFGWSPDPRRQGVRRLHDLPAAHRSPWPTSVGRLIRDDKGVHRLQADELALGLGIPSNWGDLEKIAIFGNGLNFACVCQNEDSASEAPAAPQDSSGWDEATTTSIFASET
jgi:hypothetical protein